MRNSNNAPQRATVPANRPIMCCHASRLTVRRQAPFRRASELRTRSHATTGPGVALPGPPIGWLRRKVDAVHYANLLFAERVNFYEFERHIAQRTQRPKTTRGKHTHRNSRPYNMFRGISARARPRCVLLLSPSCHRCNNIAAAWLATWHAIFALDIVHARRRLYAVCSVGMCSQVGGRGFGMVVACSGRHTDLLRAACIASLRASPIRRLDGRAVYCVRLKSRAGKWMKVWHARARHAHVPRAHMLWQQIPPCVHATCTQHTQDNVPIVGRGRLFE